MLAPEDAQLSRAITICGWIVGFAVGMYEYTGRTARDPTSATRPRVQFGIRSLFVLMTTVAMGIWLVQEVRQSRNRTRLLREFEDHGGAVATGYGLDRWNVRCSCA